MIFCAEKEAMHQMRIFAAGLDPFRNRYLGKRCFVIGNGLSLSETPLDRLVGEYSFAMNRIAMIFDKTDWRPTFYTLVTGAVRDPAWARSALEAIGLGIHSFVWWQLLPYLYNYPPMPRNVYLAECSHARTGTDAVPTDEWWSWDIGERISKHGTSMLATLQIAVFMGFNPVYLLGADNYWKPFDYETNNDPNHFDNSYWSKMELGDKEIHVDEQTARRYTHQCTTAHELAHRVTSARGVNIYNATIGGKLEVYPRVSLDDILR